MKNVSMLFNIILGFIIIILLVLLFSTNYHIVKIDTNSISEFSQEISQIDSVYINLNKSDIQKAISILEKGNITNDDLLSSLESQKETFVLIIVFLTLLIASAGLFSIFQTLSTQSEQEKLKKLTNELETEINKLKFDSIQNDMISESKDIFNVSVIRLLISGDKVTNLKSFKKYIKDGFNSIERRLNKIKKIDWLFKNEEQLYMLENWIRGSINFAHKKEYIDNISFNVNINPLYDFWIMYFSTKMDSEMFEKLKEYLSERLDEVEFGDY